MKKQIITLGLSLISFVSFSQIGIKWSVGGNALSSGNFLGSTNFEPIIFKTNNQERFRIDANGRIIFSNLTAVSNGLLILTDVGIADRLNFTGNDSDVLLGNGGFAPLNSAAGWSFFSGTTITNNKVGIGVAAPVQALEVNGNSIFNGSVAAQQFVVGDVTSNGKNLRISTNICLDGYDPSTGMRNEICVFTQPLFINSKHGYDFHTILNADNLGNVGVGTNSPLTKLHVNGNFRVDGETFYSGTSHLTRISPLPGDTVIQFGDSTLLLNPSTNTIYVKTPYPTSANKGVGVGSYASVGKGLFSTALGHQSRAMGDYSHTIGYFVRSNATNSMVIGSGIYGTYLENSTPFSLSIGFNSNLATLFVSSSSGINTTGQVGIGTTYIPEDYKLAVEGKIITEEVTVQLRGQWPDNVFKSDYELDPLESVKEYYSKYHHLKNVPSENEVRDSGINVGEMDAILLRKIEEATLYLVKLNEEVQQLKMENEYLKKQLKK